MSKQKDAAEPPKIKPFPPAFNFANGGLSGMVATSIVHPMDVLKNRLQMSTEGTSLGKVIVSIYRNEGIFKFYRGLSAGLVRQATYTTARLGIYNQLQDIFKEHYPNQKPSFVINALIATIAGSSGAFIGTPAEVALIRMTSDGRLPPDQRRNYKNVLDAFIRIVREEGATTLWRGTVATVGRAIVVNISQLATYTEAKNIISAQYGVPDGALLYFYAAMFSGGFTTFNSLPFDIAKTRIQNLKTGDKLPGMATVMIEIVRKEGVRSLWKGFWPTYCKIGPHTVFTLLFNEQFAKLYRKYFMT